MGRLSSSRCCRWDNYPVPNLPIKPIFNDHNDTTIPTCHSVFLWPKKYNANFIYSTYTFVWLQISISIFSPILLETTPSDRAGSYDYNGATFDPASILEAEIRKLPDLCLHAFSQQPLRVRSRIIGRSKDIIEEIPTQFRSLELVQGKRRYSHFKLKVWSW